VTKSNIKTSRDGVSALSSSDVSPRPVGLLHTARLQMRLRHFSLRTEKAYLGWMRRFIHFHGRRHPREMGGSEVQEFLSYLVDASREAHQPDGNIGPR
jgi:hypothetical protein